MLRQKDFYLVVSSEQLDSIFISLDVWQGAMLPPTALLWHDGNYQVYLFLIKKTAIVNFLIRISVDLALQ